MQATDGGQGTAPKGVVTLNVVRGEMDYAVWKVFLVVGEVAEIYFGRPIGFLSEYLLVEQLK